MQHSDTNISRSKIETGIMLTSEKYLFSTLPDYVTTEGHYSYEDVWELQNAI